MSWATKHKLSFIYLTVAYTVVVGVLLFIVNIAMWLHCNSLSYGSVLEEDYWCLLHAFVPLFKSSWKMKEASVYHCIKEIQYHWMSLKITYKYTALNLTRPEVDQTPNPLPLLWSNGWSDGRTTTSKHWWTWCRCGLEDELSDGETSASKFIVTMKFWCCSYTIALLTNSKSITVIAQKRP